jgi:hypothetical protein
MPDQEPCVPGFDSVIIHLKDKLIINEECEMRPFPGERQAIEGIRSDGITPDPTGDRVPFAGLLHPDPESLLAVYLK